MDVVYNHTRMKRPSDVLGEGVLLGFITGQVWARPTDEEKPLGR